MKLKNSSELRNLWVQIYHTSDGIQFVSKSINKFKRVNNCITGHELVEWLMKKKSVSKDQAIVIGQALLDGKWLEMAHLATNTTNSVSNINSLVGAYYSQSSPKLLQDNQNQQNQMMIFYDDNSFYKPGQAATSCNRSDPFYEKKKAIQDTDEGPEWIKDLNKLVTSSSSSTSGGSGGGGGLEVLNSSTMKDSSNLVNPNVLVLELADSMLPVDDEALIASATKKNPSAPPPTLPDTPVIQESFVVDEPLQLPLVKIENKVYNSGKISLSCLGSF
jgi:hypothetical protein